MSTSQSDQLSLASAAFNMRYVSLSQYRSVRQASQRTQIAIQKAIIGSITNPAKSLDLLRQTLQPDINRELDEVLRKYVTRFFKPGLRNIRDNERLSNARASMNTELIASLNEVILARICKQMLEEAAKRYIVQDVSDPLDDASDAESETRSETSGLSKRRRVEPSYAYEAANSHNYSTGSGSHYGTPNHAPAFHSFAIANAGRRKRAYDAESIAGSECASQRSGSQKSVTSRSRVAAHKFYTISPLAVAHGEPVRPASANPSHLVADRAVHPDSLVRPASANPHTAHSHTVHRSGPHRHSDRPVTTNATQQDAHLMKSETRFDDSSLFVLGSHANKALGLGAIRGKIYAKHNWLFKYVCDSEDKQWLANEASILHSSGGKAILLLRSDVLRLAETSEYRNVRIDFTKLRSFHVPGWMINKMRRSASNVPDIGAGTGSAEWGSQRSASDWSTAQHPDGGWSASPSSNIAYSENWPPGAHAAAQRHHHAETWSAAHSSGQETPTDCRTAAESEDETTRGEQSERAERQPLPFARLVTDSTKTGPLAQTFVSGGVTYAHAFVAHSASAFASERLVHGVYSSHDLVQASSPQASALELSGTFDLVDGDAVLGHGVAVEEVVTSNDNDQEEEQQGTREAEEHVTASYYG